MGKTIPLVGVQTHTLLLLGILALLTSCRPPPRAGPTVCPSSATTAQAKPPHGPPALPPLTEQELRARYAAAIKDAEQADPDEIVGDLWAIAPWNTKLTWRPDKERGARVLVATWTDDRGYDHKVGGQTALGDDVWVTAVPQLLDFCARTPIIAANVKLRLEQLLGLPPGGQKDRFVELWVDPADLFRPAADPEITDRQAMPDWPGPSRVVTVSPEHRRWIEALKASSYGEDGYPWTRLGYTYDWGNPTTEVGLSEFVVRKGALVEVARVLPTADYCKPLK